LCHPLAIEWIDVRLEDETDGFRIEARVRADDCTGVEMEALTAVSIAALTLYDMCKAIDQRMEIGEIKLLGKTGGRSGK
jgi:cyclic pyranopterin phosphate synthase